MRYQTVLFDADGMTLLSKRFSSQIEQDYGITWEKMKPFFSGPFVQCKLGKADLKEELEKVVTDWGWRGSVSELMEYWFKIGSTLNPDIVNVVNELHARGVKCILATNQEKYRAEYLRTNILGDVFDDLFVSADIGHTKDEVAYFEEVYKRLSSLGSTVSKEAILFVDHEEKNLAAAKRFGFDVYQYHDVEEFKEYVLAGY